MYVSDAMVEAAARSDAAFDGRDFDALGRADKRRYLDRSRKALEAATSGSEFGACLDENGEICFA